MSNKGNTYVSKVQPEVTYEGDIAVEPSHISEAGDEEFQSLSGGEAVFMAPKEMKSGDTYIGTFVETYQQESKFGGYNNNHKFTDLDKDRGTTIFNGSTGLDNVMLKVQPGEVCRVVYRGTKDTGKGNPAYIFDVSIKKRK